MSFEKKKKIFEKRYEEETMELLVLTGEYVGGAGSTGDGIWTPSADILAYVNLETKEVVEEEGILTWMAQEEDRDGWIYHLKDLTVYHVKCRKIKPEKVYKNAEQRFFNNFLLMQVVERDVKSDALSNILDRYREEVTIEDAQCGTFTLDRHFNWFTARLDWLGEECQVTLECDEEHGDTANQALAHFKKIYENLEEWDEKLRRFAAEKLTEDANDWQDEGYDDSDDENPEESEGITEETFAKRIGISECSMDAEGDYEVYYNDDDMFWGHVIIIDGNVDGEMEDAYIAG